VNCDRSLGGQDTCIPGVLLPMEYRVFSIHMPFLPNLAPPIPYMYVRSMRRHRRICGYARNE
jgi:hypothetical protein